MTKLEKEFWPWSPKIGSKIRILKDGAANTNERKGAVLTVIERTCFGDDAHFKVKSSSKHPSWQPSWFMQLSKAGEEWEKV